MSSSTLRRSSRPSVLGKRTHKSFHDTSLLPASFKSLSPDPLDDDNDDNDDDTHTVDLSPCSKRPRTSLTPTDRNGNKENIPPECGDLFNGSPRALRRSSTEFVTPTSTPLRRHASTSNLLSLDTQPLSMAHLGLQTPPPTPSTSLPLHIRTRALLRATCNGSTEIAGRIPERQSIINFITTFIGPCPGPKAINPVLYISGSPGCGKTALVNTILANFEVKFLENNVNVVSVNCMALSGLEAVWERLIEELAPSTKRRGKTFNYEVLERLLANRTSKCILVLDEMDHVTASSQTLASLFTLSRKHFSTMRIIGIANTHTLTSSVSALSMDGFIGVSTLHFAPYDPGQLLSILQSRLKPLTSLESPTSEAVVRQFLPMPTLTLLSRKIAAQTGDVRSLLEVLRGAIDLAVTHPPANDKDMPPVTPSHILAALKAYAPVSKVVPAASSTALPKASINNEIVNKVRNLGLHARLALLVLLLACRRSEASLTLLSPTRVPSPCSPIKRTNSPSNSQSVSRATTELSQLHTFYCSILGRGGSTTFSPVSRSEFGDLAGILETIGFVSLSAAPAGRKKLARVRSFSSRGTAVTQSHSVNLIEGVRQDEILRGLGIGLETKDICEEEVEGIWKRELARIRKEVQIQQSSAGSNDLGFDNAMED
ncbi:P-loop containing nucleoside triphosphate hydrolase protein [Multifurca ochricompacta]|uniref:P-loop containing nucleoside triphosphate hydrolase protein n=1 Tax=Multifurca ochricompacta TaxID=376703 RepID=A0AAD4QPD7_9AGAM|nr:P-loop containing nucleoside triphosphate hydrolase protein [Multifurca ochricompacta]